MDIEKFDKKAIAFDFKSDMVNATDMIKNFPEKKMNNFLRQKQTKEFINVLKEKYSKLDTLKGVTVVKQGGTEQGTWMNRILALKFAAWLSPKFELWVFEIFDKHLQEKLKKQQRELDYFWDKEDKQDLYKKF